METAVNSPSAHENETCARLSTALIEITVPERSPSLICIFKPGISNDCQLTKYKRLPLVWVAWNWSAQAPQLQTSCQTLLTLQLWRSLFPDRKTNQVIKAWRDFLRQAGRWRAQMDCYVKVWNGCRKRLITGLDPHLNTFSCEAETETCLLTPHDSLKIYRNTNTQRCVNNSVSSSDCVFTHV